jgi:hypothetical protein
MNLNNQKIEIKTESFERLESFFLSTKLELDWNCLFVLPLWLRTWWDIFGENHHPEILAGYHKGKLIGVAPLRIQEKTARFIGGENVCDYQDMIVDSNHQHDFFKAIFAHLKEKGIRFLQLETLRPDSASLTELPEEVQELVADFAAIAQLDPEDEAGGEKDFMQLEEYVKVGTLLVMSLLSDAGDDSEE